MSAIPFSTFAALHQTSGYCKVSVFHPMLRRKTALACDWPADIVNYIRSTLQLAGVSCNSIRSPALVSEWSPLGEPTWGISLGAIGETIWIARVC